MTMQPTTTTPTHTWTVHTEMRYSKTKVEDLDRQLK